MFVESRIESDPPSRVVLIALTHLCCDGKVIEPVQDFKVSLVGKHYAGGPSVGTEEDRFRVGSAVHERARSLRKRSARFAGREDVVWPAADWH